MELRPEDLIGLGNAAVVAPAGHGKTELITKVAALGRRTLILTHTHAGVNAIKARLKRYGVAASAFAVDTIAGWSMRYAHAFPGVSDPPEGMPDGQEWDRLYVGAAKALKDVLAIRQVVEASYDRVLIDEYQDCGALQHELATELSGIVPTLVFGDPMQGIFEFAGANLGWEDVIHRQFPYAGTLTVPYRWASTNPALGEWIADARERLARGDTVDLTSCREVSYRESDDAFDMGAFFESLDGKEGDFAAIHCRKNVCYALAKATRGGYQAIEEVAASRLREFARTWDRAANGGRVAALRALVADCFHKAQPKAGEGQSRGDAARSAEMSAAAGALGVPGGAEAALAILSAARGMEAWRPFRAELLRDAERALESVAAGRSETMEEAVAKIRQRLGLVGRKMPKRTVSTPLLLKGLEFAHVLVPDATHFGNESQAQAKLFYVAISRAKASLTVSARIPRVAFPKPRM